MVRHREGQVMPSPQIPDDRTTQAHAEALAKAVFAAQRWNLLENGGASYQERDKAWVSYMEAIDAADEAGRLCSVCGPSFEEV